MSTLHNVAVGTAIVGGLSATALGGYNLGHAERSKFDDVRGDFDGLKSKLPERYADAIQPAIDRYADARHGDSGNWFNAAIGLGVTGLATAGLGIGALVTKNPTAANTMRNFALATGVGAAVMGFASWKQFNDLATDRHSEELVADIKPVFEDMQTEQLVVMKLERAATGVVGKQLAALDLQRRDGNAYDIDEFAASLDEKLELSGHAEALRRIAATSVQAPEGASTKDIAAKLDGNGDGLLQREERDGIGLPYDLAAFAVLKHGPMPPAQLMRAVDSGNPEIIELFGGEGSMAMAGLQYRLAGYLGLETGPGSRVDWNLVSSTMDAALEQIDAQ